MSLFVLREQFTDLLRTSIHENEDRYRQNKPWVEEFANGKSCFLETVLEPAGKFELLYPVGDDLKDLENSVRLHKSLFFLTPVQARDPRLWTRLVHVDFWAYMRKRWDPERFGDDSAKMERFILSRYFVAQNQSRALLRNGIARLWWYSKVTFDPDRKDPYELTAILLDQLDITQQILERNLGRAPHVLTGFLEFLLRHRAELLGGGDLRRSQIRHLAKHLNLFGGTTLIDCLSRTDIITILEDEFSRIIAKPDFIDAG